MIPQSGELVQIVGEMFLQVKALRLEVQLLRSELAGKATQAEGWAAPDKAARALQPDGVKNARHLQRLRLEGVFSEAKSEIRNVSKGDRPTWQYHVPKCRTALQRHFKHLAG